MLRRPPRSTRTDTLFPTRRSSDLDQLFQRLQRHQRTGRVARRTEEENLAALPDIHRHGIEVRVEAVLLEAWQVMRRGAGEQGCAFVDLIERIRADHQTVR